MSASGTVPAATPVAATLGAFAAAASVEVTPRAARRDVLAGGLRPGTEVFLTHLPGAAIAERASACAEIAAAGMRPVPHVAAREAASAAALDRDIAALLDSGADGVMLIGGGGTVRGPFPDAEALLRSGVLARRGVGRIVLAGHPEGHPQVADPALDTALARKVALACAFAGEVRIVTQFVFDDAPLVPWLERQRAGGIAVPVRIGLSGPASPATLLTYALKCGVGPSLKALQNRPSLAARMRRRWSPDALAARVAETAAARPDLAIAGLHLFPFGGLAASAEWLEATTRAGMNADTPLATAAF